MMRKESSDGNQCEEMKDHGHRTLSTQSEYRDNENQREYGTGNHVIEDPILVNSCSVVFMMGEPAASDTLSLPKVP